MEKSTKFKIGIWAFALLLISIVLVGPVAVIWALNTLFQLGIDYTFWNWLAVIVLSVFIQARIGKNSR